VEKYGRTRHATDENIIRRMRFSCWVNKAIDTHSGYAILNCFSMATMITRTRLSVTFIRTLPFRLGFTRYPGQTLRLFQVHVGVHGPQTEGQRRPTSISVKRSVGTQTAWRVGW
jgi:hypothetical protein